MNVSEKEARDLLKAMGFDAVANWKRSKVQDKLNALQELLPESKEVEGDERTTQQRVINALDEGTKIIVGAAAEETNGHAAGKNGTAKASKKTKGAKASKGNPEAGTKAKNKAGTEKKTAATDRFGRRLGSKVAEIDKHIGKKPKTPDQLAEASGVDIGMVKTHLYQLVREEKVTKSEKGFAEVVPVTA